MPEGNETRSGGAKPATAARSAAAAARVRAVKDELHEGSFDWKEIFRSRERLKETLFILAPAFALVAGSLWLAFQFVEPAPPKHFILATGSETGAYFAAGKLYRDELAKSGVTLEVKTSGGSVDNIALLNDPKSGVQAALVQGGITNSAENPNLVSIGRIFPEPVWLFHRLKQPIDKLSSLSGKLVMIGGKGSGTSALALKLLAANGITPRNTSLVYLGGKDAVSALQNGVVDAGFFVLGPSAPALKSLLADTSLTLMSFSQAEAYSRDFPYLSHVVYPEGTTDLAANRPPADVHLIAPIAAVVVRRDLHPTLVNLLAQVLKTVHTPAGMFQKLGDFPQAADPEFELAEDAQNFYQNGPPFWQRFLPFWLASFVNRTQVMLLPFLAVVLPVLRLVPMFFEWRIRHRILYWYGKLRRLERIVAADPEAGRRLDVKMEIDRIEVAVKSLPMPARYSGELYDLRGHVDFVRQLITAGQAVAADETGELTTEYPPPEQPAAFEPARALAQSPYDAWVSASLVPA